MMDEFLIACLGCLAMLALWVGLGLLFSWALMLAWNLLVPALFHGPTISYVMAIALYSVISIVGSAFKTVTTSSKKD